jgi:hypothetical protein
VLRAHDRLYAVDRSAVTVRSEPRTLGAEQLLEPKVTVIKCE